MGIVLGIDIGGSTTKIIGIENRTLMQPLLVRANDPVASLFGALGKFTSEHGIALDSIEKIMLTGVGASFIKSPLYGISTGKVEEFISIGLGGLELAQKEVSTIVSMGTGTALVIAEHDNVRHIGGTGIGGGTILGLSQIAFHANHIDTIIELAKEGDISNIDLTVGDLTNSNLPNLTADTTASNFGKVRDVVSKGDIALGIINMVFQTIGTLSAFVTRSAGISDVILTGNLTAVPQAKKIFLSLEKLYDVNFIIPNNAEFATAYGAALAYIKGKNILEVQ